MFKAVFVDMDGTLLQPDFTLGLLDKQVVSYLLAHQVLVVPVSARPLHGITPTTDAFLHAGSPVISLNGTYICNQQEVIFDATMPTNRLSSIYNILRNLPVTAMYYSGMQWYAEQMAGPVQKEQSITSIQVQIQPFENTLIEWDKGKSGANKILVAGDESIILALQRQLRDTHAHWLNVYQSHPNYLEIISRAASKTIAMKTIMRLYGINTSETIAIGDNYNDQEMIEFAGVGVAMGNAPQLVKETADYVTDTNVNNGVGRALIHLFKLPGFGEG